MKNTSYVQRWTKSGDDGDHILEEGLNAINAEFLRTINSHPGDLVLALAAMRLDIRSLERHLSPPERELYDFLNAGTAAVDLSALAREAPGHD